MLVDVRYGLRQLVRHPGFTLVAVLTVALGTGASAAIFSVVNGLLVQPLPYPHPEQLVAIWDSNSVEGINQSALSPAKFRNIRESQTTFSQMGGYYTEDVNFVQDGQAQSLLCAMTLGRLLQTLGVSPALGRLFTEEDDKAGSAPVVILSHTFWRDVFASDWQVIGRQIALSKKRYTVVGVMPPGFEFPANARLWSPAALSPTSFDTASARLGRFVRVIGRIRATPPSAIRWLEVDRTAIYNDSGHESTFGHASSEVRAIGERLAQEYVASDGGWSLRLVSLHDQLVREARPTLLTLPGAVVLVLLIVCGSVASLQLIRAQRQRRQPAIRLALGAWPAQLPRQLLIESLALSIIGGVIGTFLAVWTLNLFAAASGKAIPHESQIGIDQHVLIFTALISLVIGILSGIVPAISASRAQLETGWKSPGIFARSADPTRIKIHVRHYN